MVSEKNAETMYEMFSKLTGYEILEKIETSSSEEENHFYAELFNLKAKFMFQEVINE